MNKRGQALIEFILLLPIIIFIILGIIDYSRIYYNKNMLENQMTDVINLYNNTKSYTDVKNYVKSSTQGISISIVESKNYITFILDKKTSIMTPVLTNILGKNYDAKVERTILHES